MSERLTDEQRTILLAPCACGHTLNDHGSMTACWVCEDDGTECATDFETLLLARVGDWLDAARARAEAAEAKLTRVEAVTFAFEGRADTLRSAWQVATGPSRFDAQTSEAIWREAGALTRLALADPETEQR